MQEDILTIIRENDPYFQGLSKAPSDLFVDAWRSRVTAQFLLNSFQNMPEDYSNRQVMCCLAQIMCTFIPRVLDIPEIESKSNEELLNILKTFEEQRNTVLLIPIGNWKHGLFISVASHKDAKDILVTLRKSMMATSVYDYEVEGKEI